MRDEPIRSSATSDKPGAVVPHWAERYVRALDDGLRIPGTKFGVGLDALLGLVAPGAGDLLTGSAGLVLIWAAFQRGVPKVVLARMAINVAVDVIVGAVPILGDLFDLVWKSNRKNLNLLERHRQQGQVKPRGSDYGVVVLALLLVLCALAVPVAVLVWGFSWVAQSFS